MKPFIYLAVAVFFSSFSYGQSTDVLSFQALFRDANGILIGEQDVGLQFSILQGNVAGTLLYSETRIATSENLGLVSTTIGDGIPVVGDFSTIDWSNGPFFLTVEADISGGSNYTLSSTTSINAKPVASHANVTGFASTLNYESVSNGPETITDNQITILNLISVSQNLNLDVLVSDNQTNNDKNGFPGFGTTTGTAFDIIWSQINENLYFPTGNVGVNRNTGLNFLGSNLLIEGSLQFLEEPNGYSAGQFHFNSAGTGFLFYTDNLGTTKSMGTGDIMFNTRGKDFFVNFDEGVTVQNSIIIGENASTGYDFGSFDLVLSSATNNIAIIDTSSSASFPRVDWTLQFNDNMDGGENFFGISSSDNGANPNQPMRLDAAAPSNSLFVDNVGAIGLGTAVPNQSIDVDGLVNALGFTGDASQLTNLMGAGTATTTNIGSTTIGADNNTDTVGDILMQVNTVNSLSISNNGNVSIGNTIGSNKLNVNGNISVSNMTAHSMELEGSITLPVIAQSISSNQLDATNASIILVNEPSSAFLFSVIGLVEGQEVTIILESTSANLNIIPGSIRTPNNGQVILEANESATFTLLPNNIIQLTSIVN